MTIVTIPSQPENLPSTQSIEYVDLNIALNFMSQAPTGITKNNNQITGLWYKIFDITFGEYIPIKPYSIDQSIDFLDKNIINIIGPNNPLIGSNVAHTVTNRITGDFLLIKRLLNIIIQIVRWLYSVVKKFDININPNTFFDSYVSYINVKDSLNYYADLITIPRRLPIYENLDDYFTYIENYSTNFVKNNKIIMYSKDFYNKIKENLIYYNLNDIDVPVLLNNYYKYIDDFKSAPNTTLFLNDQTFVTWKNNIHNNYLSVHHQILTDINLMYPYIFEHNNNDLYIVQNVKDNSLQLALYIAHIWNISKVNVGSNPSMLIILPQDISPNIYRINSDGSQLELVISGTIGYDIIDYNFIKNKTGKYAALLSLL